MMSTQSQDVWDREDEWIGVTSTAERRKRQNRLSQRAWRKRRHLQRCAEALKRPDENSEPAIKSELSSNDSPGLSLIPWARGREQTANWVQKAAAAYRFNMWRLSDLPNLIRMNVLNALAYNALTLGISFAELTCEETISPFCNIPGPKMLSTIRVTKDSTTPMPNDLRPTALQRTVPHHPWIDLWPVPTMRDRIIRGITQGSLDEDALCSSACRVPEVDLDANFKDVTVYVWGQSWDPKGWEFSIGFLKQWGWLFRDCPDVLEATNYWRARRGEPRIPSF